MFYAFAKRNDNKFYTLLEKGLSELSGAFYFIDNYKDADIIFADRIENLSLIPLEFMRKVVVWNKHSLPISEADERRLDQCALFVRYGKETNRIISNASVFLPPFVDDYANPMVERTEDFLYCKELSTFEKTHLVLNIETLIPEDITYCGEVNSNFQPHMSRVKNYCSASQNHELVYAKHKALIDLNENDNWLVNCLEALQYGCVPFANNRVPFLSENFPQLIFPEELVLLKDKAAYMKDVLANNKPSEEEMRFVANKHNYSNIVTTLITQCLRTLKTI